jgi:hypothetical protein
MVGVIAQTVSALNFFDTRVWMLRYSHEAQVVNPHLRRRAETRERLVCVQLYQCFDLVLIRDAVMTFGHLCARYIRCCDSL